MSVIKKRFELLKNTALYLRGTTAKERVEKLNRIWNGIVERKDDLYHAGMIERGVQPVDIAGELIMVKAEIDYTSKHLEKWIKPKRVKNTMFTLGKRCEIRYQSKGVVLNMPAYNAPTAETFVPMISAMAAGNAVVIKPSEHAAKSAKILEEIIHKALPENEAYVIQGGVEVAQELLSLPFNHIYYTGGNAVGKIVMKAAADNFSSITLEMGGKSPVIVDETANLENAAKKVAWGRVMNAGQVCVAPEYVIAHESISERFSLLIKEQMEILYNSENTGFNESKYVPRIINGRHTKRIKSLIDDAVKKGAQTVLGGGADLQDRFIEPTILKNMNEKMDIMNEEVFGPVISLLTYKDQSEVIEIIEKRANPLALYIYSNNKDNISFFLDNTSSGSAVINNNCIQAGGNPNLPFGGVGSSGMGRSGGHRGFVEMSNERSVVHQPLDKFRDFMLQFPPYSEKYVNMITKAIK
jgi:aldehyde dehydrogenase (NAD+)